jgi:hypothetical protein
MLRPKPPKIKGKIDFNEGLSPAERRARLIAIIVAFISIFYWFFKILFF